MISAFGVAAFLVFVAEMGDKTQLVALAFATRFRPAVVLLGITAASLLVNFISVSLGEVVGFALPRFWIQILAGLAFVAFGLWTLRDDDDGESVKESRSGPFITVAATFFLAELGDKTMLTEVAVASQQQAFIPVWLGGVAGMVLADGVAIAVGLLMGKNLPEKAIRYGAAAIFILTGVVTLALAFR